MIYQLDIVDQNHPQGYDNHHHPSHCHHHRGITLVGTLPPVSLPLSPFPKSPPNRLYPAINSDYVCMYVDC